MNTLHLINNSAYPSQSLFGGSLSKIILLLILLTATAQAQIPPKPADGEFFHDRAATIDQADEQTIRELQRKVFSEVGVPIVVVTINNLSDYIPTAPAIENVAKVWFDSWGIGSQRKNDGILVLISKGDRQGRIELGAAWGHRFDAYCQRVMDNTMIPYFKSGDYGGGIVAGVEKLADMARSGPQSQPPEPGIMDDFQKVKRFVTDDNPVVQFGGTLLLIAMVLAGLGCFVAAFFFPEYRKLLIIAGIVLIALAFVFWIVLILLAGGARRYFLGDGDGGSSGGGFGGGSSGGGGASGSW